jgi:hypothetical protein
VVNTPLEAARVDGEHAREAKRLAEIGRDRARAESHAHQGRCRYWPRSRRRSRNSLVRFATSRLMQLRFVASESASDYFRATRAIYDTPHIWEWFPGVREV